MQSSQHLLRSFRSKKLHETIVRVYQRYLGRFVSRGVTRSDSRVHMTSESARHVASMGRKTVKKSNATLVKYVACGFLTFNVVYSAALLVVSPAFLQLVLNYAPFFIVFYVSILLAAYGIYDRRDVFLYPILVMDLCFILISLAMGTFLSMNMHFCLKHREAYIAFIEDNQTPDRRFNQYYDCSLLDLYSSGWDSIKISLLVTIAMFFVAIQKTLEMIYLRCMQNHFYRVRHSPTVPRQTKTTTVSEIMDDGGLHHETEDEDDMVIYQKSAKEIREIAATEPPFRGTLYRSRTIS